MTGSTLHCPCVLDRNETKQIVTQSRNAVLQDSYKTGNLHAWFVSFTSILSSLLFYYLFIILPPHIIIPFPVATFFFRSQPARCIAVPFRCPASTNLNLHFGDFGTWPFSPVPGIPTLSTSANAYTASEIHQ
ncbi:hypothetical protein BJX61DRAFT_79703 [Aspergillus egyptiacus]|nr:hypothetical protein BJX61DRAFT_79703 [Aspergillus egyptiacus]